jgi:hypothetical protein
MRRDWLCGQHELRRHECYSEADLRLERKPPLVYLNQFLPHLPPFNQLGF